MPLSVNFPLASGLRTTGMTKFEFKHLEELSLSVNFPLASGPRTTDMPSLSLNTQKMPLSANFPLSSSLRTTGMTKFEFKHLEDAIVC